MKALTEHPLARLALCLALLSAGPLALAQAPRPFEAVYDVYVDGKPRLESRIQLHKEDGQWILHSNTEGTRGLAGFLNVGSEERTVGHWSDTGFRTATFQHHSKVAGVDQRWQAAFDWSAKTVLTQTEDGEFSLDLGAETADPLSLTLVLGQRLAAGETDFEVEIVDEDTIDIHRYQRVETEPLQTTLGCLEVVALERVRENSSRYSTGWYASALNYLPVRLRHGKRGGKEFDMRIRSLSLDAQAVEVRADCPR